MKKVISILIIAVMLIAGLFVLTGCGNNETATGGSSGSGKLNDSSNWMEAYNMSNLKVPEGATVEEGFSYSPTDKQIKRDIKIDDIIN